MSMLAIQETEERLVCVDKQQHMFVTVCTFVGCCLATKILNLGSTKLNGWK